MYTLFFFLSLEYAQSWCITQWYHEADKQSNWTQKTFEAKQANNCHHNYFIMADNRKTKETESLPKWQDSCKRLMNTKSISKRQRHSHSTQCTVNLHYANHRASFPQIVCNSKTIPIPWLPTSSYYYFIKMQAHFNRANSKSNFTSPLHSNWWGFTSTRFASQALATPKPPTLKWLCSVKGNHCTDGNNICGEIYVEYPCDILKSPLAFKISPYIYILNYNLNTFKVYGFQERRKVEKGRDVQVILGNKIH